MKRTTKSLSAKQIVALLHTTIGLRARPHGSTVGSLLRRELLRVDRVDPAGRGPLGIGTRYNAVLVATEAGRAASDAFLDQLRPVVEPIVRHLVHCALENVSECMSEDGYLFMGETVEDRVHSDVSFFCETLDDYGLREVLAPYGIDDRQDVATLGEHLTCRIHRHDEPCMARKVTAEVLSQTTDQVAADYRKSLRPAMDRHHDEQQALAAGIAVNADVVALAKAVVVQHPKSLRAELERKVMDAIEALESQGDQTAADLLDDARAAAMRGEGHVYVARMLAKPATSIATATDDERRHHGWVMWCKWESIKDLDSPKSNLEREGWQAAAHENEQGGGERPTVDSSPYAPENRVDVVVSYAVDGIAAHRVTVRVDNTAQTPIVWKDGDGCERELRARVGASLRACGVHARLAHQGDRSGNGTSLRIEGRHSTAVDVAAALAVAGSPVPSDVAVIGELSLSGAVHPVRGVLPMTLAARDAGMREIIVPRANVHEARAVRGITVRCAAQLSEVLDHFAGRSSLDAEEATGALSRPCSLDMDDVVGRDEVLEQISAAVRAGKSVLMVGPAGCGRTMIARRLPGVLPVMTEAEALEVSAVHSAGGYLDVHRPMVSERPFRAPHHTVSDAGLFGQSSMSRGSRPGEVSLATHGILYLDEVQEFRRSTLDSLFVALKEGHVGTMPATARLVASANPCACGWHRGKCFCTDEQKSSYAGRLADLKARFDMVVDIVPLTPAEVRQARKLREQERAERIATGEDWEPESADDVIGECASCGSVETVSEAHGGSLHGAMLCGRCDTEYRLDV